MSDKVNRTINIKLRDFTGGEKIQIGKDSVLFVRKIQERKKHDDSERRMTKYGRITITKPKKKKVK